MSNSNPIDIDKFDGSISDGDSETVEVDTEDASKVTLLIDNGSTGGLPATYTVEEEVYALSFDDYMLNDELSQETARSWEMAATGQVQRYRITNQSGGSATYRILLFSY